MAAGSSAITDNDGWQDYKPDGDDGWQDYKPAQSPVQQALASVPKPKVNMKSSLLGQAVYGPADNEDEGSLRAAGYAGPAGSQIKPGPSSLAMAAGPLALGARSALAIPGARAAVKAIPTIAAMEGIGYLRHNAPFGKYIPAGAEWLPMFMGKGEAAEAKPETPNPKGLLLEKNPEVAAPPEPQAPPADYPPIKNPAKALRGQLDRMLNPPKVDIKPGVPIREQMPRDVPEGFAPVDSSALRSYRYEPATQRLSVQTHQGTIHTYPGVTADEAEAFSRAESKGKAWKEIRDNHANEKIGKLKSLRHAEPNMAVPGESSEDDLTSLLQKSVKAAKKKKAGTQ